MRQFQPKISGEVKVLPGRRVIWLGRPSTLSVWLFVVAMTTIGLSAFVLGIPVGPMLWYSLKPTVTVNLAKILNQPVTDAQMEAKTERVVTDWQPAVDQSLPQGGWLKIPALKVNTEIVEAPSEDYEPALAKGVWRVQDMGTPEVRIKPTILVAHRFGYLAWTNSYRRMHSFYNLPKLKAGDRIEIDWGQRKYEYVVYAGDEGTEISDYSADLILYTCQYLESDRRIFKYAKLIEK